MTDSLLQDTSQPDLSWLSSLPLFVHVPQELLQPVIHGDALRYYHDGETLSHQGDPPDYLFLLLRGQVRILTDGIFLVARKPYEVIGEMAFVNQQPRNAAMIAQGVVQVLAIPAPVVEQLMSNVHFMRNLLHLVTEKLHEATQERTFRFRNEALLFSEFRAHLSPEVAQRLLATGKQYGAPRFIDAILLFADIRNFTERSATMTPEQLVQELNPYLDMAVSIIHHYEGMVDKFIGDAVFALWGITPGKSDPVEQAFACAQVLLQEAAALSFGGISLALGIGLNAGRVFSGNVGSEEKRQFTVLGHPVNLAARYESATKDLQVPMVIGEEFAHRLPSDLFGMLKKHEHVLIKGVGAQTLYSYQPGNVMSENRGEE